MDFRILKRKLEIGKRIDDFLDNVSESGLLFKPVAAFVVVSAHSVVLFFASQGLQNMLIQLGLPPIPLVPVSSSQAIVGAAVGIGLLKGGRGIRWRTLGGIASSWAVSPVIACIISFISLFFLQNVFEQEVYRPIKFELTPDAMERIQTAKISLHGLEPQFEKKIANTCRSHNVLSNQKMMTGQDRNFIMDSTKIEKLKITAKNFALNKVKGNQSCFRHPVIKLIHLNWYSNEMT